MQMGQWLIAQQSITQSTLDKALTLQKKWQAKLGETLLAMRAISPLEWRSALASQQFSTCSLMASNPDTKLLSYVDFSHYVAHHFIPYKLTDDYLIIATPSPSDTLRSWCESHYRCKIDIVIITARELHQFLTQHFKHEQTTHALDALITTFPKLSARIPIIAAQRNGIFAFFCLILLSAILAPIATWHITLILTTLFYLATLAFKWLLLTQNLKNAAHEKEMMSIATHMDEAALPIYSILVPLYKESDKVIAQLLTAIDALDYPKTKLDVLLITEEEDAATYHAICTQKPADYCRILRVTDSYPRTKPKACNVALSNARGEFITIYDAEDIPAPMQLRLSVATFRLGDEKLACLQVPLNYYNRDESMLTRLFSIEYSALFTQFLPALRQLKLPIPLGGTSNHMRTDILRKVKGWDPYNVTEDADLGVRLTFLGYHTDILPSLTLEESPITLNAWMKQRSRWIKGYIQTWLVYMRHPLRLYQTLGASAFFGFQLFVGAPALTFLLAPIFWCISALLLFNLLPALILPSWLLVVCSITLISGLALHWLIASRAITHERWQHMTIARLIYPFYWLLHSFACVKALWQLVFRPHFWEKTTHGASAHFKVKKSL